MESDLHLRALDASQHEAVFSSLDGQHFDLIVIGGGITGAGVALDAASRGIKTLLVEKGDFASGTSSKSTKLIHGGLRYLKNMEIALVREVGQEREIVYRNAAHLVRPDKMLLPVIRDGSYGYNALSTALWTYDRLAGVKKDERRVMLNAEETLASEPLLDPNWVKGAGLYTEYQADDARLTLAVTRKAATCGAVCLNYAFVQDFLFREEGKQVCGVVLQDVLSGKVSRVEAHVVVNAAGPWVDMLRAQQGPLGNSQLMHSKGIHIVVRAADFPIRNALYFDAGDGRMIFAIPVREVVYIGTTDTVYNKGIDDIRILPQEVSYLLAAVNRLFPAVRLTPGHIVSGWAGVRPLIHQAGKSSSEISRKDEIFISTAGLISIAGGKLTGYRRMAEKVLEKVTGRLITMGVYVSIPDCLTANIPVAGGNMSDPLTDMPALVKELSQKFRLTDKDAWWLVKRYGTEAPDVAVHLAAGDPASPDPVALAALEFGLRNEWVLTPSDFFIRRTGFLYFEPWRIAPIYKTVLLRMGEFLGWSPETGKWMHEQWMHTWNQVQALRTIPVNS